MPLVHLNNDQLWRGQLYPQGDRLIPDDLAIALGLAPTVDENASLSEEESAALPSSSDEASGTDESPTQPAPDALSLLNSAKQASELIPLPSIGTGRGQRLLDIRPESGYLSLDQAASMLGDRQVDWDAIAAWQAPEDD